MVFFFWSYEAFAIWTIRNGPRGFLFRYFTAAFVVDSLFRGANFCKYVCPLGQFNFAASLVSPFTLQARSHATCQQCATHDCIRGNPQQRGCELQLYMPQKAGNMDCTLCMDCVKACPHDNIGLFAVAPVHDLLRDPVRSSIGRFSARIDIAVLVLVVVLGAFYSAGMMVASPAYVALALGVAVVAAVAAGLWNREVFCRFSQALLPLGLAMWTAHLLFHLCTGWGTLDPALHQAAADVGWHFLSPARWGMQPALLPANSVLSVQLFALDAGLLITLYLGWRLAQERTAAVGKGLLLMLPWVFTVVAGYAVAIWIVLQPMQMRGVMMSS